MKSVDIETRVDLTIEELRACVSAMDKTILLAIEKRFMYTDIIGHKKWQNKIEIQNPEVELSKLEMLDGLAVACGIDRKVIKTIFRTIIDESSLRQTAINKYDNHV